MKLYSFCHFKGILNVNLPRAYYDTDSTDMDKIIKIPLKIQHSKMKTADSVSLKLFMSDNGRCDIPHAA